MPDDNSGQQVSKSSPWGPAGKALKGILGDARSLYNKDKGFKPYKEQGWVDFAPETEGALATMTSLAKQPNPFYGDAKSFTSGILGGDYNLDPSRFEALAGKDPISVNPQLRALMGQTPNALARYGTGIASGAEGIGTEGDYRALFNAVDPEFEKVVGDTANDLGDQISRQFGGASFGSAAHTGTIADQVGDVVSRMRSNNFNQNLANKAGILGSITGVQGQNIGNRLGAASALSGEQAGALAAKSGILGQIGGFEGANADFARGIAGDIANLSDRDIQNRMAGLGVAPGVYDMAYSPAERLAGVGAAREGKEAEELQWKMDKQAIKQMSDWDRLMQYFGVATGTGAQGNRTVTSVQQPSNPWSSILGGGLLASQLFA